MNRPWLAPLLLVLCTVGVPAADYPEIKRFDSGDVFFTQLQSDIQEFNLMTAAGDAHPALVIYRYRARKDDDLFSIAARLNLPYETIATLNAVSGPGALPQGRELLIPNQPGLFIPEKAETDLDRIMLSWRKPGKETVMVMRAGKRVKYGFLSDERFHALERAYFLGILFRFPLPGGVISSEYGMRADPFNGTSSFHEGLDIAAPAGTEVCSACGGTIEETGTDRTLGNYVVISHFGGYQTVYGHLQKVLVQSRQDVLSGDIIGIVGSTGTSTGPHLHFEIRADGRTRNPEVLLSRGKK